MIDPYQALGVAKGADEKEIKSAYRKLAKELHPDKNKDNPKATERFSDVTKAYDLLLDKEKRAQYDRGEIDGEGTQPRHSAMVVEAAISAGQAASRMISAMAARISAIFLKVYLAAAVAAVARPSVAVSAARHQPKAQMSPIG